MTTRIYDCILEFAEHTYGTKIDDGAGLSFVLALELKVMKIRRIMAAVF